MHEEVFHRHTAKRGRKEKVLRTRIFFNTLKILDFMALKVKAVERLLKFTKDENVPGVYRYVMKPELYIALSQAKNENTQGGEQNQQSGQGAQGGNNGDTGGDGGAGLDKD